MNRAPAFPTQHHDSDVPWTEQGMTLRDYFAGQALVGLLAAPVDVNPSVYASAAYQCADAMLKERGS